MEPEGYPMLASSELRAEHAELGPLIAMLGRRNTAKGKTEDATDLLKGSVEGRTRRYLALLERIVGHSTKLSEVSDHTYSQFFDYGTAAGFLAELLDAGVDADRVIEPTLDWFTSYRFVYYGVEPLKRVVEMAAARVTKEGLPSSLHAKLVAVYGQCRDLGGYDSYGGEILRRLDELLGSGVWQVLATCEVWTEAVVRELAAMRDDERVRTMNLLRHCATATSARPSEKWSKLGRSQLDALGRDVFRQALLRWLPLVDLARPEAMVGPSWENVDEQQRMHQENATVLRGLLWISPEVADAEVTRAVGKVVLSTYRKIRGLGPRAPKVGNAGVYALSRINTTDAVGQLALLKVRVKTVTAQKEIEKAYTAAAEALGLPRDEIEEMGVPTYGMDEPGLRREVFDEAEVVAEIRVEGREASLNWARTDGTPQKSVPAKVKSDHREALKELQGAAKDIGMMLTAQAERLDGMFLLEKRWPLAPWRERYLDHPLVGTLARRLIWVFRFGADTERAGVWHDGAFVDQGGGRFEPGPGGNSRALASRRAGRRGVGLASLLGTTRRAATVQASAP
jgi:hypothetical protein